MPAFRGWRAGGDTDRKQGTPRLDAGCQEGGAVRCACVHVCGAREQQRTGHGSGALREGHSRCGQPSGKGTEVRETYPGRQGRVSAWTGTCGHRRVPEGPDRQGHCVDWMPKAIGNVGQERLGVQVLGNVILTAWERDGGAGDSWCCWRSCGQLSGRLALEAEAWHQTPALPLMSCVIQGK